MSETEQQAETVAETVLVVEDEAVVSRVLRSHLEAEGYRVVLAANAGQALRSAVTEPPDLMILDLSLIDGVCVNGLRDGLSLLQWVRRTLPEANFPVIIHTADMSPDLDERAAASGVAAVFRKGGGIKDLLAAVRKSLDERKAA